MDRYQDALQMLPITPHRCDKAWLCLDLSRYYLITVEEKTAF